jgi:threonine dehydrogenase-like Zn-dependent dehydrogenase
MTRYVRVPSRILHHVPDQLPFEQACLTEPCCVAYNAVVKNARIEPGDRVIVLGPGTIGILCAAMARLCGAEVAIVGLPQDAHRLEIAKQYGCEVIIGDAKPWAHGTRRPRLRRRHRRRRRQHHAEDRPRHGPPRRLDQQGRLGPATARF